MNLGAGIRRWQFLPRWSWSVGFCRHRWLGAGVTCTSFDLSTRIIVHDRCGRCGTEEFVAVDLTPFASEAQFGRARDTLRESLAQNAARWSLRVFGLVWHGRAA